MANSMKIRTKPEGDYIEVKALIKHPMETGIRKDSKGNVIPAHYIEDLTAETNGKVVFSREWGSGMPPTLTSLLDLKKPKLVMI